MMKYNVMHRFYEQSIEEKLEAMQNVNHPYYVIYHKYHISKDDSFSDYLYKCIDIYCNENDWLHDLYGEKIYGFFRLLPASNTNIDWINFWVYISNKWQTETKDVLYARDYRGES